MMKECINMSRLFLIISQLFQINISTKLNVGAQTNYLKLSAVQIDIGPYESFSFFSVSRSRLLWMANIQLNYSVLNSYLAVPTMRYGAVNQSCARKVVCAILHMLGETSHFVVSSCILNTTFKVQINERIFVSIDCSLFVCRLFGVRRSCFLFTIHRVQVIKATQGNLWFLMRDGDSRDGGSSSLIKAWALIFL